MSLNHHIVLFDVDGVLLEAYGYLRALQDTVAFFSTQIGVGSHPPTEAEVRIFEAQGITSEWDSVPMCVAALLIERLRREPARMLPAAWDDVLNVLATSPLPLPRPDYERIAVRVGSRLAEDSTATAHVARAVLWEEAQSLPASQRETLRPILNVLLGDTHNFAHAPTTRHFQTRTIGDQGLRQAYGVEPAFESPPYLRQYDHLYLTDEVRTRVLEAVMTGNVGAAIYTARPSLSPADAGTSDLGYSPEAELARSALGLEDLPLIGLGRMHWLAQEMGTETALLVKPSPVQALAAIGAAWSGQEAASLRAAFTLYHDRDLVPPLANLDKTGADYPIKVSVFEDTVTGLRAVQQAVALLQDAGLAITYQPYGVAPEESAKAEAIKALGCLNDIQVPVYASVNDAIGAALA